MMKNLGIVLLSGFLLVSCKSKNPVYNIGTLKANLKSFWEVVPEDAVVERIGIDFEFTEGPAWYFDDYLLFSDIPANRIYRWNGKRYRVFLEPSNRSNGLFVEQDGSILACEHELRCLARISPDGEVDVLTDNYRGKRLNSPNDLCKASDGSIYFTDPPYGLTELNEDPEKELSFNGVFQFKDDMLNLIDSTLSWPNGIALSPDERYLYVANTEVTSVAGEEKYSEFWVRYTLDVDGQAVNKEILFTVTDPTLPGGPDGMAVDSKGNLFVTGPGGILVISPQGKHLGTIGTPVPASNLTFGPGEKDLYVTARSNIYRVRLK